MKFIVAAHYELGYTQEMLAEILGVTQASISLELKTIRDVFMGRSRRSKHGKPYKPKDYRVRNVIKTEDLLHAFLILSRQ